MNPFKGVDRTRDVGQTYEDLEKADLGGSWVKWYLLRQGEWFGKTCNRDFAAKMAKKHRGMVLHVEEDGGKPGKVWFWNRKTKDWEELLV